MEAVVTVCLVGCGPDPVPQCAIENVSLALFTDPDVDSSKNKSTWFSGQEMVEENVRVLKQGCNTPAVYYASCSML